MGAARGGGDCGPVRVAEAGREDYSTSKLHEPTKPIGAIPTARDVWTRVETPRAYTRGDQNSKTQRTLVSAPDFLTPAGLNVAFFLALAVSRVA